MTRPLSVVVPSRGRPGNIADLAAVWPETTAHLAELVVVVDADDPELSGYQALDLDAVGGATLQVLDPPPGNMVAALNAVAVPLVERYQAVGFMGDDHRPRTPGWDLDVTDALDALGTGIVTGRDGFRTDHLPTWCAMTSNIIRTLGYMAPPELRHMYVDNAWLTLGGQIGFTYLDAVLVEHMHPFAGKAPSDEGYERVNAPDVYAQDAAAFARWCSDDLPSAVAKLTAQPIEVDR